MELRRFLLIVTATILVALILTVWFFPSNDDFRVDNPFWNGTGDISDDYRVQPLDSLADLPPSPASATLVAIPYQDYSPPELEQLRDFVSRGGRLILADDYGYGNRVLEYLGLEARFTGQVLLDPLVNYKNRYFPRIIHLQPDPLTANTDNLVFNHATGLAGITAGNTLALSSSFSFLDSDGDGARGDDEPAGPLPVISRHEIGEGQVILVADPSLFINGMDNIAENNNFIRNIAATTSALYIDQSHLVPSDLHRTRSLLQHARGLLFVPVGTVGLVLVVIIATLIPIWHKKEALPWLRINGINSPEGEGNDDTDEKAPGNAEKHYR